MKTIMYYSIWNLCFVLASLQVFQRCSGLDDHTILQKELVGFQDVLSYLRAGYRVSFYISTTDCKSTASFSSPFHVPFGDTIDFFYVYEDWKGFNVIQFNSEKFIRKAYVLDTARYDSEIVLREGVVDSSDMATWNITVATLDMKVIIESWTFSCYFGNRTGTPTLNPVRFYATDIKPNEISTLEDIESGLMMGSPVKFTTWFLNCQGGVPWLGLGAAVNDFDLIKVNNVTVIQSTHRVIVTRQGHGLENLAVTSNITKLFGPFANFVITYSDLFFHEQVYKGDEHCIFPSGGGVRYFNGF